MVDEGSIDRETFPEALSAVILGVITLIVIAAILHGLGFFRNLFSNEEVYLEKLKDSRPEVVVTKFHGFSASGDKGGLLACLSPSSELYKELNSKFFISKYPDNSRPIVVQETKIAGDTATVHVGGQGRSIEGIESFMIFESMFYLSKQGENWRIERWESPPNLPNRP